MANSMFKPLFGFYCWKWGFWFRVFRKGLSISMGDKTPPLFSERYRFVKVWRYRGLKIKYLN